MNERNEKNGCQVLDSGPNNMITYFLLGKMKIKSNDIYVYVQLVNVRCLSSVIIFSGLTS